MIRIGLSVLACVLLFSCSTGSKSYKIMDWKFENIDHNLVEVTQADTDQIVIDHLRALHKSNPYDSEYNNIKLDKILLNEISENKYYLFDVLYIDDMQVVFVLNKQGEVVRNFVLSGFE